ncbi:unnamed protein product, partial [Coregonus sp. 'balchen']
DPSVTEVTNSGVNHIEQLNPFPYHHTDSLSGPTIPASTILSQPAVLQPSTEPSPQATERREQELQSRGGSTGKENNWPPLPKAFPINPCFYQDFSAEIPMEYQRVCKMVYYLWMFHCVTLFLNLLACLALFTMDASYGVDFGLSILWLILFTPCSFLCWYRPVYKAFKSDSSFSFFFFFFVFFCQVVVFIIQSVGIPRWGNSGWNASLSVIFSNKAVGAIMMVVAYFFTNCAVLSIILLRLLPEGPAGVLPGCAHQQDLPDGRRLRSVLRRLWSLPGEQLDPGWVNSTPRYPLHLLHPTPTTAPPFWDGSPSPNPAVTIQCRSHHGAHFIYELWSSDSKKWLL